MTDEDRTAYERLALLNKINVRSVSAVLLIGLMFVGCLFIYLGVRDDGFVDITTPFINGKLRSGFVGVVVIFLASVNFILITRPIARERTERTIRVRHPNGAEIELKGVQAMRETLERTTKILTELGTPEVSDEGDCAESGATRERTE